SIDPHVAVPETIDTHDVSLPLVLGPIGAVVDEVSARSAGKELRDAMEANGIDIGEIVYETFRSRLTATHAFQLAEPGHGSAQLTLSVFALGLAHPMGGTDRLKPTVSILGILTRTDGTILWRQADYVGNLNSQTPSYLFEEYVDHPENIRTAFTSAIQIVTDGLVAALTQP